MGFSDYVIRPSRNFTMTSAPSAPALALKQTDGAKAGRAPDTAPEVATPATPSQALDDPSAVPSGSGLSHHRAPAPATSTSSSGNPRGNLAA